MQHLGLVPLLMYLTTVSGDSKLDAQTSEAANCFTLNFYKQLKDGQSNMVSSPFSLDVLLSMLLVGSGGKTAQELQKALAYDGLSNQDIEKAFKSKLTSLAGSNGNTLNVANSIWIQKKFPVKDSFKTVASQMFLSEEHSVDFAQNSKEATGEINSWANDKTNGLIPVLFDQDLDPSTAMVLVNALYFKGIWQNEFDKSKTKDGKFLNNGSPNTAKTVKLMNQQNNFVYSRDGRKTNSEILKLDYVGGNISMILILPPKDSTLQKLEDSLECDSFKNLLNAGDSTIVDVTMPRFDVTSTYDLKDAMQKSGIREVFESSANFSGISDGIAVSKAIQKAVIKVYEEGSEAAVVTGIVMAPSGMAPNVDGPPRVIYFRADRPFLYMIRHNPSDLIILMGRVNEL